MPLLEIKDLSVAFDTDEGTVLAVDNVSLDIEPGEILGLVGESGCGKSVTALSILRLIPSPPGRITSGAITFRGRDLLRVPVRDMREIRGCAVSMIFQEPMTALSPLHRVGKQVVEGLQFHRDIGRAEAGKLGEEWFRRVGIPDARQNMYAYPFQLSGGMRQRVMIAMALMLHPDLIIADEPTTALDVTIQAQVLDLIKTRKREETAALLITHDMGVIWEMCSRVAVMYASEILESGTTEQVFGSPLHPYTEALLASFPSTAKTERLEVIPGQVPSALAYPAGCRFRDRCKYAFERCEREHPRLARFGGRCARCFLAEERAGRSEMD